MSGVDRTATRRKVCLWNILCRKDAEKEYDNQLIKSDCSNAYASTDCSSTNEQDQRCPLDDRIRSVSVTEQATDLFISGDIRKNAASKKSVSVECQYDQVKQCHRSLSIDSPHIHIKESSLYSSPLSKKENKIQERKWLTRAKFFPSLRYPHIDKLNNKKQKWCGPLIQFSRTQKSQHSCQNKHYNFYKTNEIAPSIYRSSSLNTASFFTALSQSSDSFSDTLCLGTSSVSVMETLSSNNNTESTVHRNDYDSRFHNSSSFLSKVPYIENTGFYSINEDNSDAYESFMLQKNDENTPQFCLQKLSKDTQHIPTQLMIKKPSSVQLMKSTESSMNVYDIAKQMNFLFVEDCLCGYPCHCHIYDPFIPIITGPQIVPNSYEEALAIAKSCTGSWVTILERSESLDLQYKAIGLGLVKRTVMNRISIPLTMFLEENDNILHCWIHTPLGIRHMRSQLKGEPLTDEDSDAGKWIGTTSVVDYSIPWFCNGTPVRALKQVRTNPKIGVSIVTRCVLPDAKENKIMLINFSMVINENIRKSIGIGTCNLSTDRLLKYMGHKSEV